MQAIQPAFLLLLLAFPLTAGAQSEEELKQFFPMSKGNYWVYQGTVQAREKQEDCENEKSLLSKPAAWKVAIEEVIRSGNVETAILNGYPYDFVDGTKAEGDKIRTVISRYLFIRRGAEFYLLREGDSESERTSFGKALNLVQNPSLATDDERWKVEFGDWLEFRLPMEPGDVMSPNPDDSMNRNVLQSINDVTPQIKGASSVVTMKEYTFLNASNSGEREFSWIPGIGMTKMAGHYHPAGCTMLKTSLQLVQFHKEQEQR